MIIFSMASVLSIAAITEIQAQPFTPPSNPWTPENVLISIGLGAIIILISMVAYLGKRQLDCILDSISDVMKKHTECRDNLHTRFADKDTTAQHIRDLFIRTDKHEATLQRHGVFIGGRRFDETQ